MPLSPAQERKIDVADSNSVRSEFRKLRANWTSGSWLSTRNRYKVDCIGRLRNDLAPGKKVTHSHLREYIAASAVAHCIDGWSFLGRAIEAELRGDPSVSCHLGYYAELRAAMSLLAAEGIGVFNKKHAIVNSRSRCECFPADGTHQFTWDALEYWATTSASSHLLFSIIEPGGLPLEEWLSRFSVGTGFQQTLGKSWLKQWGLDLEQLTDDRDSRNVASYRPTSFTSSGATSVAATIDAVEELWTLCEPSGDRQFATLDRHLLRHSLALTFKEMTGRTPKQVPQRYFVQVRNMLHALAPGDLSPSMWQEFLTYGVSPDLPQVFRDAEGTAKIHDPRHSKQVLARATLLLRVSTGAAGGMLGSLANMDSAELRFWWSPLGEDRGLWDIVNEPENFYDLWADIRDALQDIALWRNSANSDPAYSALWASNSRAAAILGTMERSGLWGLGL